MMRNLILLGLPAGATALHLSGPMNDALGACRIAYCPEFTLASPDANMQGTGLNLPAFLAPPLNAVPFIYDMEYALNVFGSTAGGRTPGPFTYRAAPDTPQDLVATPTTDYGPAMACMCEKCGAEVEAIFQPVGRMVCAALQKPLPCQAEFEACQAVTTRPTGYSGTQAGMDLLYPTVSRERACAEEWRPRASNSPPTCLCAGIAPACDKRRRISRRLDGQLGRVPAGGCLRRLQSRAPTRRKPRRCVRRWRCPRSQGRRGVRGVVAQRRVREEWH